LGTARCAPDDPGALAASLRAALDGPARSRAERVAIAQRYSYSALAARYLAEAGDPA